MDKKEDAKDLQKAVLAYQQGKLTSARLILEKLFQQNSMKAGRYLALIDLTKAAKRNDITSKVALGSLYEFGIAAAYDLPKAKKLYQSALADDHQDREGYMLASGADLGLGRIALLEKHLQEAKKHFAKVVHTGRPELKRQAKLYLQMMN